MSNTTKKFAGLDTLQAFLDGCKTLFASITHKHTMSDIEDYVVDTELSSTSTNPIANSTVNEELEAVSTAMGVLGSAIDDKLDTTTASSTYETKTDAQTKYDTITDTLSSKADASSVPTKVSQLTNDSGYITEDAITVITTAEIDEICGANIVVANLDNGVVF